MDWDNVQMIRNAQASAQERFDAEHIATQETIEKAMQSQAFRDLAVPRMTELESMIFKMRSELIDYIVAHGLVDGLIFDGVLQPVENGKIVITKEMLETIVDKMGYQKLDDVVRTIEEYLPEHFYVSDEHYVHTDNNYTGEDKEKLAGVEDGAEVNKIINVLFNGVSVLDDGTRVATINITPEDIKQWYESNANTNAFTDKEKAKLAGISDGAEVNRVDDVLVNGRSVLDENKRAIITKEIVKEAYEANDNTNAFTDDEKKKLAELDEWKPEATKAIQQNAEDISGLKKKTDITDETVQELSNRQIVVMVLTDEAIKDLKVSTEDVYQGSYPVELSFTATVTDSNSVIKTFDKVYIRGTGSLDGGYLGIASMSGVYRNAENSILQAVLLTVADDNKPRLAFIFDTSKEPGYIPTAVSCSNYYLGYNEQINRVQLDGEDQEILAGTVNINAHDTYVPYTGATSALDLGTNGLIAGNAKLGDFTISGDTISFNNGDGTFNRMSIGGDTVVFKTRDDEGESSLTRVNVGAPTSDDNAATKKYVDDSVKNVTEGFVPYTGATLGVDLGSHPLTASNISTADDAGNFANLDTSTLRFGDNSSTLIFRKIADVIDLVNIDSASGDQTAGRMQIGSPQVGSDAANKDYVDSVASHLKPTHLQKSLRFTVPDNFTDGTVVYFKAKATFTYNKYSQAYTVTGILQGVAELSSSGLVRQSCCVGISNTDIYTGNFDIVNAVASTGGFWDFYCNSFVEDLTVAFDDTDKSYYMIPQDTVPTAGVSKHATITLTAKCEDLTSTRTWKGITSAGALGNVGGPLSDGYALGIGTRCELTLAETYDSSTKSMGKYYQGWISMPYDDINATPIHIVAPVGGEAYAEISGIFKLDNTTNDTAFIPRLKLKLAGYSLVYHD